MERANGFEPATSSLTIPRRERQGSPRMKILEPRGFFNLRLPAFDPDFRRSPGKFARNLPETPSLGGWQTNGDRF